jgi:hypothetical protein
MPTVPSDDEIKEFLEMYKSVLPNPQNYPKTFEYYWKIFKYCKERDK